MFLSLERSLESFVSRRASTTPITLVCCLLAIVPGIALAGTWRNAQHEQDQGLVALESAPLLRARLLAEGYSVEASELGSERYDDTLQATLRRFQALHGLEEDGIVGPETLAALNISAPARAEQIARNLERAIRSAA